MVGIDRDTPQDEDGTPRRVRQRHDVRWGRAALAWLSISGALVIWALVEVTIEDLTDRTLLWSVALGGAAGGAVSAAVELVDYLGSRTFRSTWTAYFFIRPILGAALAVVLYVATRGALLSADAPTENLNQYGILALAFLTGMFAKQVVQKVLEIFDTLFATGTGLYETRRQTVEHPGTVFLDRYKGFVVAELTRDEETGGQRLTVRMQADRPLGPKACWPSRST